MCGSPGRGISLAMGNGSYRGKSCSSSDTSEPELAFLWPAWEPNFKVYLKARSKEPSAACIWELHQFLCLLKN